MKIVKEAYLNEKHQLQIGTGQGLLLNDNKKFIIGRQQFLIRARKPEKIGRKTPLYLLCIDSGSSYYVSNLFLKLQDDACTVYMFDFNQINYILTLDLVRLTAHIQQF